MRVKIGSGEAGFCTGGAPRKQLNPAIARSNNGGPFPSGVIVPQAQKNLLFSHLFLPLA